MPRKADCLKDIGAARPYALALDSSCALSPTLPSNFKRLLTRAPMRLSSIKTQTSLAFLNCLCSGLLGHWTFTG